MSDRINLRVGPEQVGARVVLRRRAPGGRYVDLLGELLSWADGVARVRTRAGEVTVPIDQVIAGRPVPPHRLPRHPSHRCWRSLLPDISALRRAALSLAAGRHCHHPRGFRNGPLPSINDRALRSRSR